MDEYCGYDVEDIHSGTELDEVMCEVCGTIQPATNKFCTHCGEGLKKGKIKGDSSDDKKKSRSIILCVALLVAVVVAMVLSTVFHELISEDKPVKREEISIELPEISMPEISLPDISDFTVSEMDVNGVSSNSVDYYPMGEYVVGVDIPAGEYLIVADNFSDIPNACIGLYDKEMEQIISTWFQNTFYVNIEAGQYLHISWCTAVDLSQNIVDNNPFERAGMFKVGTDVKAGTYRIKAAEIENPYYFTVYDNLYEYNALKKYTETLEYEIKDREKVITVVDGQYIELENCVIVKEE